MLRTRERRSTLRLNGLAVQANFEDRITTEPGVPGIEHRIEPEKHQVLSVEGPVGKTFDILFHERSCSLDHATSTQDDKPGLVKDPCVLFDGFDHIRIVAIKRNIARTSDVTSRTKDDMRHEV
jgi:hypothetical protein